MYRFVGVGRKTRKGTKKGENKVLKEEDSRMQSQLTQKKGILMGGSCVWRAGAHWRRKSTKTKYIQTFRNETYYFVC